VREYDAKTLRKAAEARAAAVALAKMIAENCRCAWPIVTYRNRTGHDNAYGTTGIVDLVLADMDERERVGRERYGTPLTAGNGRDHLIDAYQEALDFAVYLAAHLDEHSIRPLEPAAIASDPASWRLFLVQSMLWDHVHTIMRLRAIIEEAS